MKNFYFLFLIIFSCSNILCFDDMIAMLPSLRTSNKKKSFLKNEQNHTNQTNITAIATNFNYSIYNCTEIEYVIKIDSEIQHEIDQIKSELLKRSIEIEGKIKSETNKTVIESHRKDLDELVRYDMVSLKRIEQIFHSLKNSTLSEKNENCKNEALKKLKITKNEIRSFIQTMKTVTGKLKVK